MHFFRCQLLLALCFVIVRVAHGYSAEEVAATVTLPKHPAVVIPGPDVPSRIAVLSGAWEGAWSNAYTWAKTDFIVELTRYAKMSQEKG